MILPCTCGPQHSLVLSLQMRHSIQRLATLGAQSCSSSELLVLTVGKATQIVSTAHVTTTTRTASQVQGGQVLETESTQEIYGTPPTALHSTSRLQTQRFASSTSTSACPHSSSLCLSLPALTTTNGNGVDGIEGGCAPSSRRLAIL